MTSAKDALAGGKSTVHRDFFQEEFVMNHLISTLSKPYLAFADGIVFGGVRAKKYFNFLKNSHLFFFQLSFS